ncbi:uncharacterized protein TrAtP1_001800 [Trichoderma atroviride]|uniref:uncharacterized protein n=1 Tax=Hypocrea atroviridis TaxID=63577 RepID=UPI00333411D8|nr:hypothetical protein TrAtP1_001800 [Trichoderma atroviride]
MELRLNLTQATGAKSPAGCLLQIQHDFSDGIVESTAAFPISGSGAATALVPSFNEFTLAHWQRVYCGFQRALPSSYGTRRIISPITEYLSRKSAASQESKQHKEYEVMSCSCYT